MLTLPFLSLIASAFAAQSLGVILIRSGSQYQYDSPASNGDIVVPNGQNTLKLVLNSDGTLVDVSSDKYLFIGSDGFVILSKSAQTGYSIKNDYLAYDDNSGFGVLNGRVAFGRTDGNFTGTPWRIVSSSQTDDVEVSKGSGNLTATPIPSVTYVNSGTSVNAYKIAGVFGVAALLI